MSGGAENQSAGSRPAHQARTLSAALAPRSEAVPRPVSSEPVSSEPVSSEPVSSELEPPEPASSEPASPEPVSSEPVSSEPVPAAFAASGSCRVLM